MADPRDQRKFSNILINPKVQIEMPFYTLSMAFIGSSISLMVFVLAVLKLIANNPLLQAHPDQGSPLYNQIHLWSLYLFLAIGILTIISLLQSIRYFHRLSGPLYRFEKHIDALLDRKYDVQTNLRGNDQMTVLAEKLNLLSEQLKSETSGRR